MDDSARNFTVLKFEIVQCARVDSAYITTGFYGCIHGLAPEQSVLASLHTIGTNHMRFLTWIGLTTAFSIGISSIGIGSIGTGSVGMGNLTRELGQPVQAVELNGQTYFTHPPLLNNATTTRNSTLEPNPTYYFTLSIPEDAGEPLGQVVINQKDSDTSARLVRYDTEDTRAFVGTPGDRGEALPVQTTFDRDAQTVTVTFDQPVAPGTLVTIGLEADRNPRLGGVYLFGVTAYPAGTSAYGQFLGYGRLQFYERNDSDFLFGF